MSAIAHAGTGPDTSQLWRNGAFMRLWTAQGLSQVAQHLLNFALIIRVFDLAQGTRLANISVALVILAFGVPSILFGAAAGVYVDHWNRKYVMVVSNLLRAGLVLTYLIFEQNLAMVMAITFLIATINQFFTPAEAASIPVLVGPKNLLRANSLFIFTLYASFMVGYGASAPVIGLFGPSGPYILTSVMFLAATILVMALPSIKARTHKTVKFWSLIRMTRREVVGNWRIIRSDHRLSFPILQLTISQSIVGMVMALAPALSLAVLKVPLQEAAHVLVIPAGIGMVMGIIAIGKLTERHSEVAVISVGLVIAAVSLMLLGLSGQLHRDVAGLSASLVQIGAYVAVIVLLLGLMNAVVSSAAQTLLHRHTTDESRGKVFGALNMMVNIAATLPILLAGILADLTSVTKVVTVLGGLLLLFAAAQYVKVRARVAAGTV